MNLIKGRVFSVKNIPELAEKARLLEVFPTPFKGIYYAPYDSEKDGYFISNPHDIIFNAVRSYLNTKEYYFGLFSALYYLRIIWNPNGIDIVNKYLSREVIRKAPEGNYWRAKRIRKILNMYPKPIIFHRIYSFSLRNVIKKGNILYSNLNKTKHDTQYLCKKGSERACDTNKFIENAFHKPNSKFIH